MESTERSSGVYVLTWLALLALTAFSFLLSLAHLGTLDVGLALGIALIKSVLVLLFFMHVSEARAATIIIPVVVLSLVLMLLTLVAVDVATRRTFPRAPVPSSDE